MEKKIVFFIERTFPIAEEYSEYEFRPAKNFNKEILNIELEIKIIILREKVQYFIYFDIIRKLFYLSNNSPFNLS